MPEDKRQRVLVLSEIISPYRIPVFNALARHHDDLDLHVAFLSETDSGLRQWPVYKDEIQFSYEVLSSCRLRAKSRNLLLNWGLWSCLKKFSPHAIICGGYNYLASWEALHWAHSHQAALILWSESNGGDARSGRQWIESLKSYFLSRCDRFLVPGRASRDYLRSFGSARQHILTAPNAVDNDWFRTRAANIRRRAEEFRSRLGLPSRFLLFVGRLVPAKGVFDLLEAYSRLDHDLRAGIALVLAGDGPAKPELERQSRQICPGTVLFPGFLHREDLAGFYALADALVLPTHSDAWGLVVNEAMACSLPIIVSAVAGCSTDLVEHAWNGYVVPPRDVNQLSLAIDLLLRNPAIRQEMGTRSSERIRHYSPEACARGLAAAALSASNRSPIEAQ